MPTRSCLRGGGACPPRDEAATPTPDPRAKSTRTATISPVSRSTVSAIAATCSRPLSEAATGAPDGLWSRRLTGRRPRRSYSARSVHLNAAGEEVRCRRRNAGTRKRARRGHGLAIPLRPSSAPVSITARCLKPTPTADRTRDQERLRARTRARNSARRTAAYQEVRRKHPRIERKLADHDRWHDGRRVRYRGRLRGEDSVLADRVVVNMQTNRPNCLACRQAAARLKCGPMQTDRKGGVSEKLIAISGGRLLAACGVRKRDFPQRYPAACCGEYSYGLFKRSPQGEVSGPFA